MGDAKRKQAAGNMSPEQMKAALAQAVEKRIAEGQAAIQAVLEKYGLQLVPETRILGNRIAANVRLVPKD